MKKIYVSPQVEIEYLEMGDGIMNPTSNLSVNPDVTLEEEDEQLVKDDRSSTWDNLW